jgi:hypothetical protein
MNRGRKIRARLEKQARVSVGSCPYVLAPLVQRLAGPDATIGAIMDGAPVLAPPAAIAALQSELLRRMRREGAALQVEKCFTVQV